MEFDKGIIIKFIEEIDSLDSQFINTDVIVATILKEIIKMDFSRINQDLSSIKWEKGMKESEIRLEGYDLTYPKVLLSVYEKIVSIHTGIGEGEYLDSYEMATLSDLVKLSLTLIDLLTGQLTEEVIYCNDKVIGNNCSIPYRIEGRVRQYKYRRRFGSCLFGKRSVCYEYQSWI